MDHGFYTLKDLLDVIVVPAAIFLAGALLPRWFEAVKARKFLALIERELGEMEPWPKEPKEGGNWPEHLSKRFIHEEIFEDVAQNRDFILSLPPDVVYNVAQLWRNFHKAASSGEPDALAEYGARWCDYLNALCSYFDRRSSSDYKERVLLPWASLILSYHPGAEATRRLRELS